MGVAVLISEPRRLEPVVVCGEECAKPEVTNGGVQDSVQLGEVVPWILHVELRHVQLPVQLHQQAREKETGRIQREAARPG